MESIIADAEKSVDKTLKFYEDNDVPLNYRPRLKVVDIVHPLIADSLACIKQESEFVDNCIDFFCQNFERVICKDLYGLDISEEVITESAGVMKARLPKINLPSDRLISELMSGADIVIFKPYHEQDSLIRDCTMAHELWHLIEKERKLLQEQPFIVEGTATYAMARFAGLSCDKPLEDCGDFFTMMYQGGANIVQNHVKNSKNPYLAMLDRKLRMEIQQSLLDRVKPVLADKIKKMLESEEMQDTQAKMLRQIPEFSNLEGNLTAENIVHAYRQIGATKLADELQTQNLDKVISWFRKFGF